MAIRIMHILGSWGAGGAEAGILRLINSLPADDFIHSLCILGIQSKEPAVPDEIALYRLPKHIHGRIAAIGLYSIFKKAKTDIAHVNNLSPWLDTALGARLAGCKCIMTFHGIENTSMQLDSLRRLLLRVSLSLSSSVTAVADSAGELLKHLMKRNSLSLTVIPNGVDTNFYKPYASVAERLFIREKLGLPKNAFLFGCVAAFRPVKNHAGLLKAFQKALCEESPDSAQHVSMVFVGNGPLQADMHSLAKKLGIEKSVIFLGNRNDVPHILRALDVFVLNSTTEGLSYAILEAMATGLPVIATDVGANPQIVAHGNKGCIVRQGDENAMAAAIAYAIRNKPHLVELGAAARREVIERYSIQAMAAGYMALYEEIMGPNAIHESH